MEPVLQSIAAVSGQVTGLVSDVGHMQNIIIHENKALDVCDTKMEQVVESCVVSPAERTFG